MASITEDPQLRAAQIQALQGMQGMQTTGITPAEWANFRQSQIANNQQLGAQQGAINQAAQQRGLSTSGLAMAQQIAAQQGAADRNYGAGVGFTQNAQQRALQALQSGGQMAQGIRRSSN